MRGEAGCFLVDVANLVIVKSQDHIDKLTRSSQCDHDECQIIHNTTSLTRWRSVRSQILYLHFPRWMVSPPAVRHWKCWWGMPVLTVDKDSIRSRSWISCVANILGSGRIGSFGNMEHLMCTSNDKVCFQCHRSLWRWLYLRMPLYKPEIVNKWLVCRRGQPPRPWW